MQQQQQQHQAIQISSGNSNSGSSPIHRLSLSEGTTTLPGDESPDSGSPSVSPIGSPLMHRSISPGPTHWRISPALLRTGYCVPGAEPRPVPDPKRVTELLNTPRTVYLSVTPLRRPDKVYDDGETG